MTQRPIGRGERVLIIGAIATLGLSMLAGGRRAAALPRAAAAARHAAPGADPPTDPGRTADSPADIPPRGWWSILKRVAVQVSEDRVMAEAASVTYYALLAIFPTLAALVSLYGLVADPNALSGHLSAISGLVPGGGMQIITEQVKRVASAGNGALGFGAIIGLLVSIWSANAGIKSMFEALNAVYDEHEARSFVRRTLLSLAFTLGAMAFVLLAMGAVVVLPVVLNVVGLGSETETLLRLARWPLLLVAVTVFLAFLYRFGPSRAKASWRWVSWGGGLAAIGWIVVSLGFSYYVQHFGSFNRTYGSLGAAIGFMTWIWISAIVVLIGAELNAEMEHQTARDTTTGPARPSGARGAVKADSVAA
jgi:membrane protein